MSIPLQSKKLLTVLLASRSADRKQLELDQNRRLAPMIATRALLPHEYSAQVMFADLEDDLDAAVIEATELLAALHADVKALVMLELFGEERNPITPAEAQAVITRLAENEPEELRAAESNAALLLAGTLAAVYLLGGRRVAQEAARQGVPAAQTVGGITPAVLTAADFEAQARAVAHHPWRRIVPRVEQELAQQSTLLLDELVPNDIGGLLDQIKIDGSVDEVRQAVTTSSGRGRIDTVETSLELDPQRIWASEIMDGDACETCDLVDGREFADLAEARTFYPNGYHYRCRGGARCRGTLIFEF